MTSVTAPYSHFEDRPSPLPYSLISASTTCSVAFKLDTQSYRCYFPAQKKQVLNLSRASRLGGGALCMISHGKLSCLGRVSAEKPALRTWWVMAASVGSTPSPERATMSSFLACDLSYNSSSGRETTTTRPALSKKWRRLLYAIPSGRWPTLLGAPRWRVG